jgi:hypothetical protein
VLGCSLKRFGPEGLDLGRLTPEAFLFIFTGLPRLVRLEEGVGVSTAHAEALACVEQFLDRVEPNGAHHED